MVVEARLFARDATPAAGRPMPDWPTIHDYAGLTMPVVDARSGEIRNAQIFVGALGASHLIYAEATWTQSLSDWIGAHVRLLEYVGGVPALMESGCQIEIT